MTTPGNASTQAACDISLSFGSTASGIDRPLFRDVEAYLAAAPFVADVSSRSWGREGERDLCVRLQPGADAAAVFAQILERIPATTSRGWLEVTAPTGESHRVERAR
ncbi:MAG: hypothetical protein AAF321_08915 [Pseudomonadota bacterium]